MKDFNQNTKSDMPLDQSFAPKTSTKTTKPKTTTKPKINAIGKKSTATQKSNQAKKSAEQNNSKLRTKLTGESEDIKDLEKLNEENIKNFRFRGKRNKVIIAILSVLLAVAITVITVYMIISKLDNNCELIVHGNVNAEFYVNGEQLDAFRTPANVQGNRVLNLDIDIKINDSSDNYYNVKFVAIVYQGSKIMSNTLIYKPNFELFEENQDGYYYSAKPIQGAQKINICEGVILDKNYENTLNIDNFKMEFHIYFEKV